MDTENQTSLGFWDKIKLTNELLSLLLVFLGLAGIVIFFICIGKLPPVCMMNSFSWIDIVLFAGGSIALTAGLSVPILPAAVFGGIVWFLVRAWMCIPPGN